jgi:hypothetical protein
VIKGSRTTIARTLPPVAVLAALILLGSTGAWAQPETTSVLPTEVAELVRAFVPDELTIVADLNTVKMHTDNSISSGRKVHEFSLDAVAADGTNWMLIFEIDAKRGYLSYYVRHTLDRSVLEGEAVLTRPEAEAVAREFAAKRFPRPLEDLELESVLDPAPPHAGGLAAFSFFWRGKRGNAWTGDSVSVTVLASTGDIIIYSSRPALDFADEEVVITEERAIADVRDLIQQMGLESFDDVTFSATLWLSHPEVEDEGPAWRVLAKRPSITLDCGCDWYRMLTRIVDARTGEITAPHEPLVHESSLFMPDPAEEE